MVPSQKSERRTRAYSHTREQVTFREEQAVNTPAWRLIDRTQLRRWLPGLLQHSAKSTAPVTHRDLGSLPTCAATCSLSFPHIYPLLRPPRHRSASRQGAPPGRAPRSHPRPRSPPLGAAPGAAMALSLIHI